MKRKLTCMILLFMGSIATWAQNAVLVYQVDGNVATFSFTEKPVVTYNNNELVLSTSKTTVTYPIYLLKKLSFDIGQDTETAVEEVKKPETQFDFQGGMLTVNGGEPGSPVSLYNLQGIKLGQYSLDDSGRVSIPVQNLSKGVYIVKTKYFTFKFHKS